MNSWRIWRNKKPLVMYSQQDLPQHLQTPVEVRYAVPADLGIWWIKDAEGEGPVLSSSRMSNQRITGPIPILCPRNIAFAPENEDLDPRQWAPGPPIDAKVLVELYEKTSEPLVDVPGRDCQREAEKAYS